jgi:hypothetical protein
VKFMEKRITMNSVQYTDTLMVNSLDLAPSGLLKGWAMWAWNDMTRCLWLVLRCVNFIITLVLRFWVQC